MFISWSGERSKVVALKLRDLLQAIVPKAEPWMSREDIRAGATWLGELRTQLDQTDFGIVCLTPGNQTAAWLLFEAGALAKKLEQGRVVPYLIGFAEVPTGPLGQFQAKLSNENDTWEVVRDINRTDPAPEPEGMVRIRFDAIWPQLNSAIEASQTVVEGAPVKSGHELEEKVDELLKLVRGVSIQVSADRTSSGQLYVESAGFERALVSRRANALRKRLEQHPTVLDSHIRRVTVTTSRTGKNVMVSSLPEPLNGPVILDGELFTASSTPLSALVEYVVRRLTANGESLEFDPARELGENAEDRDQQDAGA